MRAETPVFDEKNEKKKKNEIRESRRDGKCAVVEKVVSAVFPGRSKQPRYGKGRELESLALAP